MGLRNSLLVALLLCVTTLQAQIHEAASFEHALQKDDHPYFAINGWEHGLLLYRQFNSGNSFATKKKWEVLLIDSLFIGQWATTLTTEYTQHIIGAHSDGTFSYFLLVDYSKSTRSYQIIRLNLITKQLQDFELGEYVPEKLMFLRIHHDLVIIGGTEKNRPSVVCYRFGDKRAVILQGIYGKNNTLLEIQLLEEGGFMLYVGMKNENRERTVSVNVYDDIGSLENTILINSGSERSLLDCRVLGDIEKDLPLCLTGTYSTDKGPTANGVFTVLLHPDGRQVFKYYSFGNLKNFFGFLPPEAERRELERIRAKKSKGKKDVYDIQVSIRDPLVNGDEKIFVGDCFTRSNQSVIWHYGLQASYNYSHSIFVGIDNDGKVYWDNAMALDKTIESSELQQTFLAKTDSRYISFTYKKHTLIYKFFDESGDITSPATYPLSTDVDLDLSFIDEQASTFVLRKWYDNHYLLFGVNQYVLGSNQPPVFFMKKISVDIE